MVVVENRGGGDGSGGGGGKGKRKKEKNHSDLWWRLFSLLFVWRSVHSNYVFRLEHRWLNGNRSLATLLI